MFKIHWKKLAFFFVLLLPFFFAGSIYFWVHGNGSSFRAALIRGVTKVRVATASNPDATTFLPVRFDHQDHKLSCEVAVLKMALAYRQVRVNEDELLSKLPFDKMPHQNGVWGNPNKAFVGNIDGKMLVDGYGVYWYPVANVARQYRDTFVFEHWRPLDLAHELEANNPVMIWGWLGGGQEVNWKTTSGQLIHAFRYEHVFLVNGYTGDVNDPTGFYLMDPIYGQRYYATSDLLRMWNSYGRSGIVVH